MTSKVNPEGFLRKLTQLEQYKRDGERAPHKPLLLLHTFARIQAGGPRLEPFSETEVALSCLLDEFGPSQRRNTHYPFWRLRNDDLWDIPHAEQIRETASGDALVTDLRAKDVAGGLPVKHDRDLREDEELLAQAGRLLLYLHFPPTIYDQILEVAGLEIDLDVPLAVPVPLDASRRGRSRDPQFRPAVLHAYEERCAICGYDAQLDERPVGVEAAHIRWHRMDGPDEIGNGLCLCTLHHKTFDRGLFTFDDDLRIRISGRVTGGERTHELLMDREGQEIQLPHETSSWPEPEHILWHRQEVFRPTA